MIELTRLNDKKFTLNSDLIETVEEVPDTSITLTTGKKIMVKESRIEVKNLVKEFKKEIYNQNNI
ncbi:MAG: flagellar FlbD family protein [Lachnospiraceae bacterium]|nr:flagellar FlbD family protein [Lachnospiraceae bacterium]